MTSTISHRRKLAGCKQYQSSSLLALLSAESKFSPFREIARLAIGSLSLEPYLDRQNSDTLHVIGQQSDKEKDIKLAAALGYAAHVTYHLAQYLGVPLKYPIKPSNSHSTVTTAAQTTVTAPYGRYECCSEISDRGSCQRVDFIASLIILLEKRAKAHKITHVK